MFAVLQNFNFKKFRPRKTKHILGKEGKNYRKQIFNKIDFVIWS